MPNPRLYDISIVLNLHNEASFLARTLWSLEETTRFAQHKGLAVELVVVLDRASAGTRSAIKVYAFSGFDAHQIIEVDNGSLGLSRNDGISVARGTYISLADGDDLVSYNYLHESYLSIKDSHLNYVSVPEYLYAFGDNRHIVRYFGSEYIDNISFFQYHPYISRLFCHFSLYENFYYNDFRLNQGFAFEDWHLNCELIANKRIFVVAQNAILFYRQRPRSLLRQAMSMSANIIDWSSLFKPDIFVNLNRGDLKLFANHKAKITDHFVISHDVLNNTLLAELSASASYIDPAIDSYENQQIFSFSNIKDDIRSCEAYYNICDELKEENFTDIVLVPYLIAGGGEKYILNFICTIAKLYEERKFLFLSGESIDAHTWADKIPKNSKFIDLRQKTMGCEEGTLELITLRLIQWVGLGCTLYLKNSVYVDRFFLKYGHLIRAKQIIYFRFSDPMIFNQGRMAFRGYSFNFLSEFGHLLSIIISDNSKIITHDSHRLPELKEKYRLLYAECPVKNHQATILYRQPSKKLLWASRLAPEKRPDILLKIGDLLAALGSEVTIDVYGSYVTGGFNPDNFSGCKNIDYRGKYDSFDDLPVERYDGFIYTSLYDGLPNVVLEAMAAGLVVVAADVGGISEAVTSDTGILIENSSNNEILVGNFIKAIDAIYKNNINIMPLRERAVNLLDERHSTKAYSVRVGEIISLL